MIMVNLPCIQSSLVFKSFYEWDVYWRLEVIQPSKSEMLMLFWFVLFHTNKQIELGYCQQKKTDQTVLWATNKIQKFHSMQIIFIFDSKNPLQSSRHVSPKISISFSVFLFFAEIEFPKNIQKTYNVKFKILQSTSQSEKWKKLRF